MKSQQVYYHLNENNNHYHQFSTKEILEEQRDTLLDEYHAAIKNGRIFKNIKKIYVKIKKIKQDLKDFEMKEKLMSI